ncbi:NAD-dependent epimerase/dehydratase family protein [Cellulomonas endophytica]|uniref:NAD-dependent epimerase/dehydratase family protein n=1 Tax=Cellulomonas endophytica TaxID=2494735 RepID=UPI0010111966|nr:NAD-dependent epimerase/dehydratase family protein [Cellulomonas endophytica]
MRVVVVGASGNVGTALLRRFRRDASVTSVVGVVRRPPRTTPPAPYDVAEWVGVDLADPGPDERTVERLAAVFRGADAVVHAAWAIQPSHDRGYLRRVNVGGTRRVVEAVARARVRHLVVLSSVGAYSPGPDLTPRTEDWPTRGIRSSSYSVDKAAVEALLDESEERLPGTVVARVRPALVFQRRAGHEQARYFLGPFVPVGLLDGGLPFLPWPSGLRLQAVHADDLAEALREVVVRQARGAFNVAGPGVVTAPEVATIMTRSGEVRDVPATTARLALSAAWHARLAPAGPGWLDMALEVPLMDTGRATRELDLRPVHSGLDALREVVAGMARGAGHASPPLRGRALR